MTKHRLVVIEMGADERDTVTREVAPLLALMPVFEPIGAGRGEWEDARAVEVEYIRPARAAA